MAFYELIPADESGADFAVVLDDGALAPYVPAGGTVYLRRSVDLCDGDVGLFRTEKGMAFRQFCQDSRGTVYLFTLDRSEKAGDLVFPVGSRYPVCYGKVLLDRPIPLPMD
ncbi:MAG: hypothetical protein IKQ10_07580 [Oscillospiraceae bacterium]|nr:hypothetical protein [Oscillospiraceae bacterium]